MTTNKEKQKVIVFDTIDNIPIPNESKVAFKNGYSIMNSDESEDVKITKIVQALSNNGTISKTDIIAAFKNVCNLLPNLDNCITDLSNKIIVKYDELYPA